MKSNSCSNVLTIIAKILLTVCCLALSGCGTTRQAQFDLEQENMALERQIQENYAFMRHQQRRINALEAQRGTGRPPAPPISSRGPSFPASTATPRQAPPSSSRSWLNPDTGLEDAEPESQPAALEESPLNQLDVDPNAEPNISVPDEPTQNVPKNLFRNSDGSQSSVRPSLPTRTLPIVNVSEIAEISLDPEQIGPLQIDFNNQEEGLRMILNCRTKQGSSAVAVGQVTIVALDPTLMGDEARVARWDISPSQVERQINEFPQPDGILFELAWPENKPKSNVIDVFVRMEDANGMKLQTHQQVQMDGVMYALWTPPAEEALPIVDDESEERVAQTNAPSRQVNVQPAGEMQQGEITKSVIVVASPQVEALRQRTKVEVPPTLVSSPTQPQTNPSSVQNASAAPAAAAPSATPESKPVTKTATRPSWSPYR